MQKKTFIDFPTIHFGFLTCGSDHVSACVSIQYYSILELIIFGVNKCGVYKQIWSRFLVSNLHLSYRTLNRTHKVWINEKVFGLEDIVNISVSLL